MRVGVKLIALIVFLVPASVVAQGGRITVAGSNTVRPIVNGVAPGSDLATGLGGSGQGIQLPKNGEVPMLTSNSTSGVIKEEVTKVVAHPYPSDNKLPPTLTVRTAALLELHAMRQSAVDLCLQLPTKYRTHLPQCAEIFKHEIRLETLAKDLVKDKQ